MLRDVLGALVIASLSAACAASDESAGSDGSSGDGGDTSSGGSGSTGPGSGAGGSPACEAGLPSGFAPTPAAYALPTPRCQEAFDAPAKESGEAIAFRLVDLTGDAAADLVVSRDVCDATVGADHWDLYAGGAEGFAASPTPYGIPAPRCDTSFDAVAKADGYSAVSYGLMSLTGDGMPDLVVTSDGCDEDVGLNHWDVYPSEAAGFAAVPTSFAIPAPRCDEWFDAVAKDGSYSAMGFLLVDLTGDGAPDLVVTSDECDAGVGESHWDVHAAGPDGFAPAPVAYAIPTARCQEQFDAAGKNASFAAITFTLMDLTADGRPDLVVTSDDCDSGIGQDHWDVYAGQANGFATTPMPYAVPAPRCQERFDSTASDYGAALGFSLVDLSCDQRPDLVVTSDGCDSAVGQDHWDVYEAGPSGFTPTPATFAVPAPRCNTPFDALAAFEGTTYGLGSMPGAPTAIVVYADQCDAAVGDSHWDVYTLP
jgi:hypothetical protein